MAKATLVEADIEDGSRLYMAVEGTGVHVAFAAWLRLPGENDFSLYLAVPEVETIGPIEVYDRVAKAIKQTGIDKVSLGDVIVSNARNHFTASIASALHMPGSGKERGAAHIVDCEFNGVYVKEMFLYKSDWEMVTRSAADFAANQDRKQGGLNRKQRRAAQALAKTDGEKRLA